MTARRGLSIVALALAAALPPAARAVIGTPDATPAATLLLPYFESNPAAPNGASTVFRVANASAAPALAHVTLWTDLGVPSFAFDVYLAGRDVVDIDLRLVLSGILPQTGPTLTNPGNFSGPPTEFPGCETLLAQARLSAETVQALRNAHTGLASSLWGGQCGGRAVGDGVARGYATVDVVNRCSVKFPGDPAAGADPAYFVAGGTGIAGNANVLWGEFWHLERDQSFAYGAALAAVEADAADPLTDGAGDYTFYGRRLTASGADNRERLPGTWRGRFLNGGVFDATHALVWRDPGLVLPFACGAPPPKLQQLDVTPVDEEETVEDLTDGFPIGFQTRVPFAAERIDTSDPARLPMSFDFGFLHLGLDFPASVVDPLFAGRNQAHATFVFRANGRFAGAVTGYSLPDGQAFPFHPVP